jgi:hypothetical protein
VGFPDGVGTADAKGADVQGTITSRDVLLTRSRSFVSGAAFYVRCIRAIATRRSCTFLDVLAGDR